MLEGPKNNKGNIGTEQPKLTYCADRYTRRRLQASGLLVTAPVLLVLGTRTAYQTTWLFALSAGVLHMLLAVTIGMTRVRPLRALSRNPVGSRVLCGIVAGSTSLAFAVTWVSLITLQLMASSSELPAAVVELLLCVLLAEFVVVGTAITAALLTSWLSVGLRASILLGLEVALLYLPFAIGSFILAHLTAK